MARPPLAAFHWLTLHLFVPCRCPDSWIQRGVLHLVGWLRRLRWQHSEDTAPLLLRQKPVQWTFVDWCRRVFKGLFNQYRSSGELPLQDSLAGLPLGFWRQAEVVVIIRWSWNAEKESLANTCFYKTSRCQDRRF